MDEVGTDLVEVARIFSRPEMICLLSALEDQGIQTFVTAFHHGNAEQIVLALGGYSVRVPEFEVENAVALIAEIRLQTEVPEPSRSLRFRIRALFTFLAVVGGMEAMVALDGIRTGEIPAILLASLLNAATYPFPMRIAGAYRNRSGTLIQIP